jgi:hypothetical protein
VFNLSGQFSLDYLLEGESNRKLNPLLVEYEHTLEVNKYYSLIEIVRRKQVPIFYFYPGKCDIDNEQSKLVEHVNNVYKFTFNLKEHGKICYPINFLDLFDMSISDLIDLINKKKGKIINLLMFSFYVSGWPKTLHHLFQKKFHL